MHVIFATDGSIEADIAMEICKRLPLQNIEFTVATVTPTSEMPPLDFQDHEASARHIEQTIARQLVDRTAEYLRMADFRAEALALEGDAGDELLKLVLEQRPDLVLAGCNISSRIVAFFLGSVARKLIYYSPASVLLGRPFSSGEPDGSCEQIRHKENLDILIAYDGSRGSELALESLAGLQGKAFRRIYVVSIEPYSYMPPDTDLSLYLSITNADRDRIEQLAKRGCAKIQHCAESAEALTGFGRPSSEINRLAKEKNVDLIMSGATRHGAVERALLGSCAYEIALGAPCSILILRGPVLFRN